MAKKEEVKIVLERKYNIPLRSQWLKVPRYKRAKKAAIAVRKFLIKHMKPEEMDPRNVKLGKYLNDELWKHGIKNPPHHIKVDVTKDDKGLVKAELEGAPVEKKEEKKERKKKPANLKEKIEQKLDKKDVEKKVIEKEKLKELKKEKPKTHAPKVQMKENKIEQKPNAPANN